MMRFMPHNERALDSASFSLSLSMSLVFSFLWQSQRAHTDARKGGTFKSRSEKPVPISTSSIVNSGIEFYMSLLDLAGHAR